MEANCPFRQVWICHDSKCRKRGSDALARQIKEELQARGLGGKVEARCGGCNSLCKRGPSIVVKPDGVRYAELTAEAISRIVSQHLMGGEPVREWVAKDKSSKDSKAVSKEEKKALKAGKKHDAKGKAEKLPLEKRRPQEDRCRSISSRTSRSGATADTRGSPHPPSWHGMSTSTTSTSRLSLSGGEP